MITCNYREVNSLMNEVNILHQLCGCSYVINLLGLCIEPGHYAIVMEYIEGRNLYELLIHERDAHPDIEILENRAAMALEIARGMGFLHSQAPPIIHRDLKSANVLVDNNYHCKVKLLCGTDVLSNKFPFLCRLSTLVWQRLSSSLHSVLFSLLEQNRLQEH